MSHEIRCLFLMLQWGDGSMTTELVQDVAPKSVDTVRALCHDLRQPLAAIRMLAAANSGDVRHRLDGILDQAEWMSQLVEGVIGGAANDPPEMVDVVALTSSCVRRAQQATDTEVECAAAADPAVAYVPPVALTRAISCLLDNMLRAAGPGGHVIAEVTAIADEITIRIIDDGVIGLGLMPDHNSLGLTITRALVCACGGGFELTDTVSGGVVAQIALPRVVVPDLTYGALGS
jgi:signal transduction histidine kinase